MLSLTSPRITIGLDCEKLRTKDMYLNAVVDPDEATFYDAYDCAVFWCVSTQTGFGPDGQLVRPELCRGERGCFKSAVNPVT